jgi:hypothetical protein
MSDKEYSNLEELEELEVRAAAKALGINPDALTEEEYNYFSLRVFSFEGKKFALGDIYSAYESSKELIEKNILCVDPAIIMRYAESGKERLLYTIIKTSLEVILIENTNEYREACSNVIISFLQDFDSLAEEAIRKYGNAYFLSSTKECIKTEIEGESFYCFFNPVLGIGV